MATTIIIGIICIFAVVYILSGLTVISQSETRIVERLGKYQRTLSPGINFILPILESSRQMHVRYKAQSINGYDKIYTKTTVKIDLREQLYDFPRQNVITKDNVQTEINALLYFQIIDPKRAIYEIDNLPNAIEKLTQTTLRNVIGEMELDDTLSSRDTINSKLQTILDDATNKWGVKVTRVELQDITPPETVRQAMERQMQAERKRRADILNAEGEKASEILKSEGEKASQINRAEAEKQATILYAEGQANAKILQAKAEAEAIAQVTEAIAKSKTDPAAYMLTMKYIEALKAMSDGNNTKTVYLPYEASNLISALGSLTALTDKNKAK
ncbi:MAG: SPFH/Band 7/PHB domain protein [Alistipes sp.]|nr:SPFH/Band 7/PHB domain protein [Alistipes sp.]